jgi:hypothetical protein
MTFVRPAAGAIAFASAARVITEVNPVLSLGSGIGRGRWSACRQIGCDPPVGHSHDWRRRQYPVSIAEDIISTLFLFYRSVLPVLIACLLGSATAFVIWWFWRHPRRTAPTT